jgi:hypothetical protein
MPIPTLIPIADEGDERLTELGRYTDGLYLGCICADRRHWVASLHTFTADGVHRGSRIQSIPMGEPGPETAESYEAAARDLAEMLTRLDNREIGDIAIQPFSASGEGFTIALIVNEEHEFADLLPVGIRFSEPWDGGYST